MKLVENILTRNPCYTAGRKITVKGLMLHSVGCPQPKASAYTFIIERTPFPWGGVRGVAHGVKGVSRGVKGWGETHLH